MPIDVEYLREGTFIRVKGHGVVTDDDYRNFTEEMYASDDRTRRYRGALVDLSRVETATVSTDTVLEVAAMNLKASKVVPRGAAVAIIAPNAMTYSLSRTWEGAVEKTGWRVQVFKDAEVAEHWFEAQLARKWRMLDRLSVKLDSPNLEARFRLDALGRDARVVSALMLLSFLFNLLSFPTDRALLAGSGTLAGVWFIRGVSAATAIGGFLALRRCSRVALFDTVVVLWAVFLISGIICANAVLPADYTAHVAWDLFFVLAVYVVVPLPLSRQVIIALIITVSDSVLFWQYKTLPWPAARFDIVAAFSCANLVGIFASWNFQRWRRRAFQAICREADARNYFDEAWGELKILKGLISICAKCKKVRTDEGNWRQVEAYVRDHSEAEFSHGVCPDCARELYSELYDKEE